MALNKEQQKLREIYRFVNIGEEDFIERYNRAENAGIKTKEAFEKEMRSYLENNLDIKTMQNLLNDLKINQKNNPSKIKQSLPFSLENES